MLWSNFPITIQEMPDIQKIIALYLWKSTWISELHSNFLKPLFEARQCPFFNANNSGIKLASTPANPVKPVIQTSSGDLIKPPIPTLPGLPKELPLTSSSTVSSSGLLQETILEVICRTSAPYHACLDRVFHHTVDIGKKPQKYISIFGGNSLNSILGIFGQFSS